MARIIRESVAKVITSQLADVGLIPAKTWMSW